MVVSVVKPPAMPSGLMTRVAPLAVGQHSKHHVVFCIVILQHDLNFEEIIVIPEFNRAGCILKIERLARVVSPTRQAFQEKVRV